MEPTNFNNLAISEELKKALTDLAYTEMTPIQKEAIPYVLAGRDLVAQAPTGTGKTACFAIPIIQKLQSDTTNVQVLVLCPTRELAIQVTGEFKKLLKYYRNLKAVTVYGGQDIEIQLRELKKKPQIVVGTPGRVMDHLRRKTLLLDHLQLLVLDEADEMLNMGFKEDLDVILSQATSDHQTLLFSATMPNEIIEITKQYQKDAVNVKTTSRDLAIPDIKQYYIEILEGNKTDCLSRMIDTYNFKQALVFCRTKRKVDEISFSLTSRGYQVECLHGDMKQSGREKVLEMFRSGVVRVLIATDVAARGLDIEGIDVVFNYDITDDIEYYIHRIGRTARAGRKGSAYSFVLPKEVSRIKDFAKKLKMEIEPLLPPTYQEAEAKKVTYLLDELAAEINHQDLLTYYQYVCDYLNADKIENLDPAMLAAAFLKRSVGSDPRFKDAGLNLTPERNRRRNGTPEGYQRLFINLGKIDGLTKAGLVDLVRSHRHVEKEQINGIELLNTYAFFEIPEAKVSLVQDTLNNELYNGRRVNIEISTPKTGKSSSQSGSRGRKESSGESRNKQSLSSKQGLSSKPSSYEKQGSKSSTKSSYSQSNSTLQTDSTKPKRSNRRDQRNDQERTDDFKQRSTSRINKKADQVKDSTKPERRNRRTDQKVDSKTNDQPVKKSRRGAGRNETTPTPTRRQKFEIKW